MHMVKRAGNADDARWSRKRRPSRRRAAAFAWPSWFGSGLVVDRRRGAKDIQDLLLGLGLVDLLHRRQLACEPAASGFEDLPLGIALLRLIFGAEQVAH